MRSTADSSPRTRRLARHSASSFRIRPRASRSSWSPGFREVMPKKAVSAIKDCTRRYEAWLASHITLIPDDLRLKHTQMKTALFPFMRATYYRWAEVWPQVCGDLTSGTETLSVGAV